MHYREFEKSKSFGNRVEWEIFSNYLSYKAHQFQRLCTSQYRSSHPQPRALAGDSQHYVALLVNQVISKANEAYSPLCPGAGGAGI